MQVILLDKVANLGSLGDQVNVKAGYARNFLVPQGKAVPATKKNVEFFEARRAELEAKLADVLSAAEARATKINELGSVTIASKAGDEGKLFGSIGTRDIAEAISAAGVEVAACWQVGRGCLLGLRGLSRRRRGLGGGLLSYTRLRRLRRLSLCLWSH